MFGFPDVRMLLNAFVKASHLVPSDSELYADVRQFMTGKRRLYAGLEKATRSNARPVVDFPRLWNLLEEDLGKKWLTPEMSKAIFSRLEGTLDVYLTDFVHKISGAALPTTRISEILGATFFAQRLAVDLNWLEQKWGIGVLRKILPKGSLEPNPVAQVLRWIRKLEGWSQRKAALLAGLKPIEVVDQMSNWETGRSAPRKDSFPLLRKLYGLETNEQYRLWFWIALCVSSMEDTFRKEIADGIGRTFDLSAAQAPLVEATNAAIVEASPPTSFQVLVELLCKQSVNRKQGDRDRALAALDEFHDHVVKNGGLGEFHVPAMAGRIAMLSHDPTSARDHFQKAVELAQYQEPHSVERILREAAAIFHRHRYAVPLKDVTDLQWIMGVHPIQIRKAAWDDDDTWESVTEQKRVFDYFRYFPPQAFFDRVE
ncbi:hypothetical protein ASE07_05050 [Noviherbaspirillum sp. Root189]|nr:hypothetical protein ASE07_05050 [Noviherbaspirillum sp. Root189]